MAAISGNHALVHKLSKTYSRLVITFKCINQVELSYMITDLTQKCIFVATGDLYKKNSQSNIYYPILKKNKKIKNQGYHLFGKMYQTILKIKRDLSTPMDLYPKS